jgi:uncharacterized membrane protein
MTLSFAKKNLFDAYVNDLQKQKIPTKQLESAHLKTLMQFSKEMDFSKRFANSLLNTMD